MREIGICEAVLTGYADRAGRREEIFDFGKYPSEPNWDALNRHMDSVIRENAHKLAKQVRQQTIDFVRRNKEGPTMQVSYNGFTGELVKLEKMDTLLLRPYVQRDIYNLSIYDSEKQVTHSFTGVKLEDVKFLGGAVSFGG